MTDRYLLKDTVFKSNTRYQHLSTITPGSNPMLAIFRLLTGSINIEDTYKNNTYRLKTNFTNFPASINLNINQSIVADNFPDEIELRDLNLFFRRARFNNNFYSSIKPELIKCLIAFEKGKHFESFFYIYRVLEGISYSLPLIYVSKNNNFDKTYRQLQSFFGKDKNGELAFFRKFICESFGSESFFSATININFNEIEIEELKNKYYEIYLEKLKDDSIIDKTENEEIVISFIGLYDFLIELRNRYFHLLKGSWQSNISSTDVLYPDYFFKPIVKNAINWIGIILFEVIKIDFEKGTN